MSRNEVYKVLVACVDGAYLIELRFILYTIHMARIVSTGSSKGERVLTFTPSSIRSIRKLDTIEMCACLVPSALVLFDTLQPLTTTVASFETTRTGV